MDAGSFVIALLTAAGAAAGPAPLGALQDTAAPAARCIAAPDEERLGSARPDADTGLSSRPDPGTGSSGLPDELVEELADIITRASLDSATRQDSANRQDSAGRQDSATASSALAEELAQELADVVAESDDPTSRRLAAALAAAGFEASATAGSRQETAASRSDDNGLDDRSGRADQDRLGEDRVDDSRLDQDRVNGDDGLDRGRQDNGQNQRNSDDRLADDQLARDDQLDCDGRAQQQDATADDREPTGGGADRSSDLEDVLSSQAADRERAGSERSDSSAGRGGSGIADALERGERTAG
jgi:hypothetical protein